MYFLHSIYYILVFNLRYFILDLMCKLFDHKVSYILVVNLISHSSFYTQKSILKLRIIFPFYI